MNPQQNAESDVRSPLAELESSAVENYVNILQSVVSRMANNSSNCKTWCVTIVSALLVVLVDKGEAQYGLIVLIPVTLFCFLDAYYLALERAFRDTYNSFIRRLHQKQAPVSDIYLVIPHYKGAQPKRSETIQAGEADNRQKKSFSTAKETIESLKSPAIWPFYGTLYLVTILYVALA